MRTYRRFSYRDANFRICCEQFDAVTGAIARQRESLEAYVATHAEFLASLVPLDPRPGAPEVARRMADAARLAGVGPMAAVAGAMAQLAAEAGVAAGAPEAVVENGGDIFMMLEQPAVIGLYAGKGPLGDSVALAVEPGDTPVAICSSSSRMGRSMSLGDCDLATVVAADAALADAAATHAANLVASNADIPAALEQICAIEGVRGALLVKGESVGMVGRLPQLVKGTDRWEISAGPEPSGS
jgi:uncharacterized protein